MAEQQKVLQINPETPYGLMGAQLINIINIMQHMPRSVNKACESIESIIAQAQVLQLEQHAPEQTPSETYTPPPQV